MTSITLILRLAGLGGFHSLSLVLHQVKMTGSEGTVNSLAMKTVVVMSSKPLLT